MTALAWEESPLAEYHDRNGEIPVLRSISACNRLSPTSGITDVAGGEAFRGYFTLSMFLSARPKRKIKTADRIF